MVVESLTLRQLVSVMNLSLGKQEGELNLLIPKGDCDGERSERRLGKMEALNREKALRTTPKLPGNRMWWLGAKELELRARERCLS